MGLTMSLLAGGFLGLGLVLVVLGTLRRERSVSPTRGQPLWKTWGNRWNSLPQRQQLWIIASLSVGVLTAVMTGFLLAAVLIPLLFLGIPALLTSPPNHEVEILAALDRWVRLLASAIGVGKSIRDAIAATRGQVPVVLRAPVARLTARMDQGMGTREALLMMADEIGLSDSDAVLAALAISSTRGGMGTRDTLTALSATIQHRLRVLREISAERAKPRAVVKQVTLITLGVLGGSLLLGGQFFEPYRSPVGQLIALALAGCYVGALAMLRRRTIPAPSPRFLRAQS